MYKTTLTSYNRERWMIGRKLRYSVPYTTVLEQVDQKQLLLALVYLSPLNSPLQNYLPFGTLTQIKPQHNKDLKTKLVPQLSTSFLGKCYSNSLIGKKSPICGGHNFCKTKRFSNTHGGLMPPTPPKNRSQIPPSKKCDFTRGT